MTQVVTVHTDFTDLNQMAQGLVGRVNDTHVILPGPDPVDVGDWVQFAVTLYDGSPGFAGVGRCVTVVDNGEERMSHQRFDVVIDSLQFDTRGQQVFEHILTLNGGGEYEAGDADANAESVESVPAEAPDEVAFEDVSADFSNSKIELPADDLDDAEDEMTMIGDSMAFAAAHHATETAETRPPPKPVTMDVEDEDEFDVGDTPPPRAAPVAVVSTPPARVSAPPAVPPARQTNGAASFSYPDGLPFPAQPPRPELDATLKVSPAPRPRPERH